MGLNERERVKGISKDFWESLSVVRYYKYASDADGSDSLGKARSPSILWLSVFLRSSELSEELKCQILVVCAACTITRSEAASGLAACSLLFITGVLKWSAVG